MRKITKIDCFSRCTKSIKNHEPDSIHIYLYSILKVRMAAHRNSFIPLSIIFYTFKVKIVKKSLNQYEH